MNLKSISPLDEREYSGSMFFHKSITGVEDLARIFKQGNFGVDWKREDIAFEDNIEIYRFSFSSDEYYTASHLILHSLNSRFVDESKNKFIIGKDQEPEPPFFYNIIVIICKQDGYLPLFILASPFGVLTGEALKTVASAYDYETIRFVQIDLNRIVNLLKENKTKKGSYDISLLNVSCMIKGDEGVKKITILGKTLLASALFYYILNYEGDAVKNGKKVSFEISKCKISAGSLSLQIDALAKLRFRVSLRARNLTSFAHVLRFITTHRENLLSVSDTVPFFKLEQEDS